MKYNPSLSALSFPEKIPPLFDPSRVYNRDMIAVESARLAYFKFEKDPQSRQIIESALAIVGFDHVEYFSGHVHGGQAVAAWQIAGNDALIAFRGTQPDNLTDIVTDLQIPRSAWPEGGTVHSGFRESFEELWNDISAWHDRSADRHALIAGHSLGAGLATLCATRVQPGSLFTIGSSRVGDAAFAALFSDVEVQRFIGCCDVVTSLPSELFGFVHVAEGRYIDRHGADLGNAPSGVISDDRMHARGEYFIKYGGRIGNVLFRDLADHAPVNYASAVLGVREE
jgi:hypothetical protein